MESGALKDGGETTFKRSTSLNASKAAGGAKKITAENLFLLDVGEVMELWHKGSSKAELANSGIWWRTSYRAEPNLMRSILNEVRCMVKEGKIKTNPGAAAVDLWKRWIREKVPAIPKQKAAATAAA